jgi:LacI family transcriptional regulator
MTPGGSTAKKEARAVMTKGTRTRVTSTRPSLHDVARLAGVSAAAVSYVVNGRTSQIGPETCRRITEAINQLRYQPQRSGLSLKFNREFAIGLVIVDPDPNFLGDPFTTQVASGLSNALVEPGFGLTVTGCRGSADLDKMLRRPIGVDGFVVMTSGHKQLRDQVYRTLSHLKLPLVIIQEEVPPDIADACAVLQDDTGGARDLTRHLLECGAANFLFVAPSRDWPAIERREEGILGALPNQTLFSRLECNEQDFDGTVIAVGQKIDQGPAPDVIMGANDQIAIAAMMALDQRGFNIPSDIMLTGYNNFAFRNYVLPKLTTVSSSAHDIGRNAAFAMLSRLDSGRFPERRVELPVSLDIGGSTLPNLTRDADGSFSKVISLTPSERSGRSRSPGAISRSRSKRLAPLA